MSLAPATPSIADAHEKRTCLPRLAYLSLAIGIRQGTDINATGVNHASGHQPSVGIVVMLSTGLAHDVRADPITFNFSGPVHERSGIAPSADILAGSWTIDPRFGLTVPPTTT